MASWKFTDDYGAQFPALNASVLSLVVFSSHSLDGTKFLGTIDLPSSGRALQALASMASITSIQVSGQVVVDGDKLTVALASFDNTELLAGFAKSIPIIGPRLSAADIAIQTITTKSEDADEGPGTDQLTMSVTIPIGVASVTLTAAVPMAGGSFSIQGTFQGVKITLADVSYLAGKLSGNTNWFPATQLGPYFNEAGLALLGLNLTLFIKLAPFSISISSVSIGIGMVGFALMDQKLYLTPLGVWTVVTDPLESPKANWSIVGGLALCSYNRPGDYEHPDLALDLSTDLTNFLFSAQLENPSHVTINTVLQDLLGQGTSIGLPDKLTLSAFDLEVEADRQSGSLSSFGAGLTLSGGFGIFENVDIQEISMSVDYSA